MFIHSCLLPNYLHLFVRRTFGKREILKKDTRLYLGRWQLRHSLFTLDNHILWCVELGQANAPSIIDKIGYR